MTGVPLSWERLKVLVLDVPLRAFWLSLPIFHTKEIDDWRLSFRFRIWWAVARWSTQGSENGLQKALRENQSHGTNPQRRHLGVRSYFEPWSTPPFRQLGLAPSQGPVQCIVWHVAREWWHLLEKARLRSQRCMPSKARPTTTGIRLVWWRSPFFHVLANGTSLVWHKQSRTGLYPIPCYWQWFLPWRQWSLADTKISESATRGCNSASMPNWKKLLVKSDLDAFLPCCAAGQFPYLSRTS